MHRRIILVAAVLAMLPMLAMPVLATPQNLATATAFLAELYARYSRDRTWTPLGAEAHRIFSPRLLDLIRRDGMAAEGEVGVLDGDPICACQDSDGLKMQSLTIRAAGPGKARADVGLSFFNDVRELTFDLEDQSGGWRIADVHSDDMPSLAGLLEDDLKRRGKEARP
jgi:hypothetical protein